MTGGVIEEAGAEVLLPEGNSLPLVGAEHLEGRSRGIAEKLADGGILQRPVGNKSLRGRVRCLDYLGECSLDYLYGYRILGLFSLCQ